MNLVVMIPTYNEAGNIAPLVAEVLTHAPQARVLVVDDRSPDGTGRIVAGLAARDPRVVLLDRPGPRGRGHAGREGFLKALDLGAEAMIEMDGDFSHPPRYIPALAGALEQADVALGSRFAGTAGDTARAWPRRLISRLAGAYLRALMGYGPITDPTSGFRAFRREALEKIDPATLRSADPFIVTEVLFRCTRAGCRICEIPIKFENRRAGASKLGLGILLSNLGRALRLRLARK